MEKEIVMPSCPMSLRNHGENIQLSFNSNLVVMVAKQANKPENIEKVEVENGTVSE